MSRERCGWDETKTINMRVKCYNTYQIDFSSTGRGETGGPKRRFVVVVAGVVPPASPGGPGRPCGGRCPGGAHHWVP